MTDRRSILRRTWCFCASLTVASTVGGGGGRAADPVVAVSQRDRQFTTASVVVPLNGILQVENDDEFVHQIYINAPTLTYESDEQEPGRTVDVHLTKPGMFEVRCHIHPRMLLQITVR